MLIQLYPKTLILRTVFYTKFINEFLYILSNVLYIYLLFGNIIRKSPIGGINFMITVKESATAEVIEKKSKFIAHVFPVQTQEEAETYLAQIRKLHYNASHNCYAYQIGERNEIQRFSDDGEPSLWSNYFCNSVSTTH